MNQTTTSKRWYPLPSGSAMREYMKRAIYVTRDDPEHFFYESPKKTAQGMRHWKDKKRTKPFSRASAYWCQKEAHDVLGFTVASRWVERTRSEQTGLLIPALVVEQFKEDPKRKGLWIPEKSEPKNWRTSGQTLDNDWTGAGQALDSFWTENEAPLDKVWTEKGSQVLEESKSHGEPLRASYVQNGSQISESGKSGESGESSESGQSGKPTLAPLASGIASDSLKADLTLTQDVPASSWGYHQPAPAATPPTPIGTLTVGEWAATAIAEDADLDEMVQVISDGEFDARYLNNYSYRHELLVSCRAAIAQMSEQPLTGRKTCADVMGLVMTLLRKHEGLNAPRGWYPAMDRLRKTGGTMHPVSQSVPQLVRPSAPTEEDLFQELFSPASAIRAADYETSQRLMTAASKNSALKVALVDTAQKQGIPGCWTDAFEFVRVVIATLEEHQLSVLAELSQIRASIQHRLDEQFPLREEDLAAIT